MKEETVGKIVIGTAKIAVKTTSFMVKAIGRTVFIAAKMAGSGIVAVGKEGLKSIKGGTK